MDILYYLSILLILTLIVVVLIGLIKPKIYRKILKNNATRPRIVLGGVLVFFVLAITLTITEPASVKQARLEREQQAAQSKQIQQQEYEARLRAEEDARNKETSEEVKEAVGISFTEQTKEDGSLAKGQTKVIQEGKNGEKTVTSTVIYRGGVETSRTVKSEEVTKQPVTKITAVGTYVAPAPSSSSSSGSGYTNSQGNYVPSPSSNPAGASAKCRDGTYSYSQSRSGTCSHHGGVAQWL